MGEMLQLMGKKAETMRHRALKVQELGARFQSNPIGLESLIVRVHLS